MSDGVKDPAQIERELAATRARLGSHLDELARRLSPGQLLDEGLSYLRDGQGAAFARNLGAQARDNPLPVALTGIGIAWLAISGSTRGTRSAGSSSRKLVPYKGAESGPYFTSADLADRAHRAGATVTRAADETEDAFRDRVSDAQAKVLGITRNAEETASAFADRVRQGLDRARETAAAWGDSAREGMQRAGDAVSRGGESAARMGNRASGAGAYASDAGARFASAMAENPLLLAAAGLTAGALVGALLPQTSFEEKQLGPAAGHAADSAQGFAQDVLERGANVAHAAAHAGLQAAREQGTGRGRDDRNGRDDAGHAPSAAQWP